MECCHVILCCNCLLLEARYIDRALHSYEIVIDKIYLRV
jgi:hypothetical protein